MEWIIRAEDEDACTIYIEAPFSALNVSKAEDIAFTSFLSLARVFRTENDAHQYIQELESKSFIDKGAASVEEICFDKLTLGRRWWIRVGDGPERYICKRGGLSVWGASPSQCDTPAFAQLFLTESEAERYLDELVNDEAFDRELAHIECIAYEINELRLESGEPNSTSLIVQKESGRWFFDAWYKGTGMVCAEFCESDAEHVIAILKAFDEKLRRLETRT